VLDKQNSPLPVPVDREIGGVVVRQLQLIDYPYLIDIRADGFAQGEAPTLGLTQLTMSWAAAIDIDAEKTKGRKVTRLIQSSAESWISNSDNVVPDFNAYPDLGFEEGREKKRHTLGAMVEGAFKSFFAAKPSPLAKDAKPAEESAAAPAAEGETTQPTPPEKAKEEKASITSVIDRSPDGARIILLGSGSFLSDDVLSLISEVDRTQYMTPLSFAQNIVDWSLEDRGLLALRARGGQFARTLAPIKAGAQARWEYLNYAFALVGLAIVYFIRRYLQNAARRRYESILREA
jgi:ABC-2 type transport system permease protein